MKAASPLNNLRFAPCKKGLRLLITSAAAAGRAGAGAGLVSPDGSRKGDDDGPLPTKKMNLTRREIYRGKISLRKKSTNLEERTPLAPNS